MWKVILTISLGASIGAVFRWILGVQFNSLFPTMPLGTLIANLIGGYIIGIAIAYFSQAPDIAPEWRLLIITGFCGGLTTFSTFSAEVVTLLQQDKLTWAINTIIIHVSGSLMMTLAGLATWQLLKFR